MKLLFENWRKFLVEQYTDWTAISEDDLYDLSYEELVEMKDEIEEQEAKLPGYQPHAGTHLLPTIYARIDAIEESEAEDAETARVEAIYSGEYAMKLAKAYLGSANQGIELASMVPDAESLAEEFKKLRGLVQELLGYAEASDMSPWRKWGWNEQGHPNSIIGSTGALINQLVDLPAENHWDMDELVDERKEILTRYHRWLESLQDLENYTFWQLAKANRHAPATVRKNYIDSYNFIKDWVGLE